MRFETFASRVGTRIRELREERDISQEEVAGIGMSVRNFQRIEAGQTNVTARALLLIAKGLGVHPRELLDIDYAVRPARTPHRRRYERVR